jgi:hypothetical protein
MSFYWGELRVPPYTPSSFFLNNLINKIVILLIINNFSYSIIYIMSSSKRHFTAVVNSKEHGLYISASPSSAARKIVSKLCSANKSKKVEFCVRETTQKSEKKTYGPYLGEMKKLAKPIELKGRVIRYAPVVHLKKKKSATKTAKKIGKKMRGGGS